MIRVLGIDDGPFKFTDRTTPVVGVLMRPGYVDGVMISEVTVDGRDATDKVIELVNGSRFKEQIRVIILDGIALGGFNVVDLERVLEETDIPLISVTRDEPDFGAMKKALRSKFDDWEWRWDIISRGELTVIDTGHKPIHVKLVGLDKRDATETIKRNIIKGALPEPLRIAHLIATAMVKGESRGKA